jgi:hypothetical protein
MQEAREKDNVSSFAPFLIPTLRRAIARRLPTLRFAQGRL